MNNKVSISTRSVLLLGDGSDLSLSVVRALSKAGITDIHEFAVDNEQQHISKYSRHLTHYFQSPNTFDKVAPEAVLKFGEKCHAQVIIPITEEAVMWVSQHQAALSSHFKLPALPKAELVQTMRDKRLLHEWLSTHDFPVPQSWHLDDPLLVEKLQNADVRYPLLLKNRSGAVGQEVSRLTSAQHLNQVREFLGDRLSRYIVQEYLEGSDMDCSILALDGKIEAITIQEPLVPRNLRFASTIRLFNQPDFRVFVEKLIQKLRWSGIAHLDFRYDRNRNTWYLVDFNARYWTTMLGSVCAGINFPYLHLLQALQVPIAPSTSREITFMLNYDALLQFFRRTYRRPKKLDNFRFMHTELHFSLKDPVPELFRFVKFSQRKWRKMKYGEQAPHSKEVPTPHKVLETG